MSECGEDYWVELGRRAAACPGWRWMPGTRWVYDAAHMCGRVLDAGWVYEWPDLDGVWSPITGAIPDLRDPATVGCLHALVRMAWGHELEIECDWYDGHLYRVVGYCPNGNARLDYWSANGADEDCRHRAGVLVQALENAPRKG